MDWSAAIEKNRQALKRVLAVLVAMARLPGGPRPEGPQDGRDQRLAPKAEGEPLAHPTADCPLPTATLSRHLHRAVLRLLRPAEAAARRLVIVAARGMVVEPPRPRKPQPVAQPRKAPATKHIILRNGLGLATWHRRGPVPEPQPEPRRAPRRLCLPLFDPLRNPLRVTRRYVPPHAAPRILSFDGAVPHRLPPPPSSDDRIDATRLLLRFEALGRALDDLPRQARRFARWRARRDAARKEERARAQSGAPIFRRFGRVWPLKPGRPPGSPPRRSRGPTHEVHDVLDVVHGLAMWSMQGDTS